MSFHDAYLEHLGRTLAELDVRALELRVRLHGIPQPDALLEHELGNVRSFAAAVQRHAARFSELDDLGEPRVFPLDIGARP